jgi:hypothetical protein
VASEEQVSIPPQTPMEGVPVVYVNWLRTQGTPNDLSVDLGYQSGNMPPLPAVHVVMTWEIAKLLSESLTKAIEGFEGQIGESIRDIQKHMRLGPPQFGPTGEDEQGGKDDD